MGTFDHFYYTSIRSLSLGATFWYVFLISVVLSLLTTYALSFCLVGIIYLTSRVSQHIQYEPSKSPIHAAQFESDMWLWYHRLQLDCDLGVETTFEIFGKSHLLQPSSVVRMRPFLLVISLLNLRYALLVSHQRICNFGQRVRFWWWNVKATQEGDHVNVITQITHETNMKFW